ncbi:MAG TPA: histidine phosphatase family protein, partial [Actinopolymorphaceae bacterium]
MRLYIVRHADPDYARNTITPRGHEEAKALAKRLATVGLSRIYTSPMGRAQHTAQYTAEAVGIEPITVPWTAELAVERIEDLDGEPTATWNVAGELVRGREPLPTHDTWHELDVLAGVDCRGTQQALADASDLFLAELGYRRTGGVYEVVRPNEEAVAVFCHAGFGVSWLAHLLALPLSLAWCGFFWAPSSVTTVLMEQRSPRYA